MLHLVGARDENVPPDLVLSAAQAQGTQARVIPGFTHGCCWEEIWPAGLADSVH